MLLKSQTSPKFYTYLKMVLLQSSVILVQFYLHFKNPFSSDIFFLSLPFLGRPAHRREEIQSEESPSPSSVWCCQDFPVISLGKQLLKSISIPFSHRRNLPTSLIRDGAGSPCHRIWTQFQHNNCPSAAINLAGAQGFSCGENTCPFHLP